MKRDFEAVALILMSVAAIVTITLLFVAAAQWLAGVAYRMGLVSNAAQWTIYAVGLCLCIGVTLTLFGRIVDNKWWFR